MSQSHEANDRPMRAISISEHKKGSGRSGNVTSISHSPPMTPDCKRFPDQDDAYFGLLIFIFGASFPCKIYLLVVAGWMPWILEP